METKKKYEFTGDNMTIVNNGTLSTLHRIRAIRYISSYGVRPGDLGGWIQKEDNLSHEGDCWVADNAKVFNNASIEAHAFVGDTARVYEDAIVTGEATVCGDAKVHGDARIIEEVIVTEHAEVTGHCYLHGQAIITGEVIVGGIADIAGDAHIRRKGCYFFGYLDSDDITLTRYRYRGQDYIMPELVEIEKFKLHDE